MLIFDDSVRSMTFRRKLASSIMIAQTIKTQSGLALVTFIVVSVVTS